MSLQSERFRVAGPCSEKLALDCMRAWGRAVSLLNPPLGGGSAARMPFRGAPPFCAACGVRFDFPPVDRCRRGQDHELTNAGQEACPPTFLELGAALLGGRRATIPPIPASWRLLHAPAVLRLQDDPNRS